MNVLRELSAGKMDEEIAKTLHLSVYTVKKYISHLKDMTGYRNRTELAVAASPLSIPARSCVMPSKIRYS